MRSELGAVREGAVSRCSALSVSPDTSGLPAMVFVATLLWPGENCWWVVSWGFSGKGQHDAGLPSACAFNTSWLPG